MTQSSIDRIAGYKIRYDMERGRRPWKIFNFPARRSYWREWTSFEFIVMSSSLDGKIRDAFSFSRPSELPSILAFRDDDFQPSCLTALWSQRVVIFSLPYHVSSFRSSSLCVSNEMTVVLTVRTEYYLSSLPSTQSVWERGKNNTSPSSGLFFRTCRRESTCVTRQTSDSEAWRTSLSHFCPSMRGKVKLCSEMFI